ncbi:GNAT family N-acetyltransferase [Methylorubrum zatmanii]|uniref:GNAT family N-acetyltransferase n=1 Tax=Methylorubrum zatmanii TaxID=29429 RepID=A0ABW1WLC1_9HYPH|nr:GNAT family N-acetyltransferase [Methylorubrum zatmanii]MBD8905860.1 GNAT family N-acetyltransferase [Methylorubrum zatmanii]
MLFRRARRDSLSDLPGLETARLSIAPLTAGDARALRDLTDDPAITGAVDFLPSPFTLADAEALIGSARHGRDRFLGAWTREGACPLIGVVGTHLRGEGAVEIGYWIGGGARGQGFGAEAVSAILGLLRGRFPRRAIMAECRPGNVASWGLLHRLGFRETGSEGHRPGRRQLVLDGP